MTQHAPQTPEHHQLAATLRGLRVDANLSTTALAARLGEGWSQSRVSRIERGVTRPTPADVEQWARATNADPNIKRQLMAFAEQSQVQLARWRQALAPGRVRKQQEIAQLEQTASVIRVFSADTVPGLAQTRAYAAAMFRLGRLDAADDPEDVGDVLDARLARQLVLDRGTRVDLLMSEFALHRHLVSGAEQRDQIGRLLHLAGQVNVRLGVISFAAAESVHQYHAYSIIGDPQLDDSALVLVETVTGELTVRNPEEIAEYVEHFERLDSTALHGDALRGFLREVVANVTWS